MVPFLHRLTPQTMEENPLWLVVLCDMMTNLMLFFIVMYAFTRQPEEARKKFVEGLQSTLEESRQKEEKAQELIQKFQEKEAAGALKELFKKAGLQEMAEVELTERQIKVTFSAPILFRSGEAELSQKAKEALAPVGKLLSTLPNAAVVEGHTDAIPVVSGPYRTNWELSVARAHSVLDHLSKAHSVPEARFVVAGYGEYRPVDSNLTRVGRARNRRIEVVIQRQ